MYPHQDDRAISPLNGDDDIVDNPCSQYPAQLYNQIDIAQSRHHDPRSNYAYAFTSASSSSSYPPPPPTSPSPGPHTIYVHGTPHYAYHPDAPAMSIWDLVPAADNPAWCDPCYYSEPVDASHRWSPAHDNSSPTFASPFCEPLPDSIEEDPYYNWSGSSLPVPDMEQAFMRMQVEGALQEHPPPSPVYSEAGATWASSSPDDDQPLYTDHHEQRVSPYSVLGVYPPPHLHPAGTQSPYAKPSFQGSWRQSPERERPSGVDTPAGENARAPIRRPQITELDPILLRSFPGSAACISGDGPSTPPSHLPPTRSNGRSSPPPHPRSVKVEEQVPQTPIASRSRRATRRRRTNRINKKLSVLAVGEIWIPAPGSGVFSSYALTAERPPTPTCAPEYSICVMKRIPIEAFPSSPADPAPPWQIEHKWKAY
ncbi:hypothetical protein JB92DRAFT_463676 [Gautieria morchelliformis]|nr:hypothetical protein JB92DRAFT_463676 [Gautieria morchelliformis]